MQYLLLSCFIILRIHLYIVCSLYVPDAYICYRACHSLFYSRYHHVHVVLVAAQLVVKNFRRESFKNSGMTCNTYRFSWLGICHHSYHVLRAGE